MTTKIYQAQLPLRNYRIITPVPLPRPRLPPAAPTQTELAAKLKSEIEKIFAEGFWYCQDCDCRCERIEGEQGQPAHCGRCGGHHLDWNPPVHQALRTEAA